MDFVEEFVRLTDDLPSPKLFRKWAGISLVSAALSRRTWTSFRRGKKTYPNLFVLLVGGPTTGKTVALDAAKDLIRYGEDEVWQPVIDPDHLAPDKITARKLTKSMSYDDKTEGKVDINVPRQHLLSKKVVLVSEWSDFLKPDDQDMMTILSNLWDCPSEYHYETSTQGHDDIYNAYLVLAGGVQPYWFGKLPTTAFEQGFMTRLIFIFSEDQLEEDLFGEDDHKIASQRAAILRSRFEQLTTLEGEFTWYPAAKQQLWDWVKGGKEPVPTHPLLKEYNGRRLQMLGKLAMISAASRTGDLKITARDLERAMEWLFEAEATAPKALRDAGSSPYHSIERMVVARVVQEQAATGKSVAEALLRRVLARQVSPQLVGPLLDGLVAQGRLVSTGQSNESPRRQFMAGEVDDE